MTLSNENRKESRGIGWACLLVAVFVPAIFAPLILNGHGIYFSAIEEGFPVAANYPWDIFAASHLKQLRFPLWNPYASGGTVFLANWLEAFFFLPRWFLYLSPSPLLRDFYVLIRFWLGGIFFFVFLRRIGIRQSASLVAVVCFLGAGYFTRFYNENYLTIELLLGLWMLAADNLATRRTLRATLLCGLAVAGILTAGHPTAAFHTLLLMGFWIIYRSGRAAPRAATLYLLAGTIATLAAGVQLVTFMESWAYSSNCHIRNLGRMHYELKHLATLAYPWIYGDLSSFLDTLRLPRVVGGVTYSQTAIPWLPYYLGAAPLLLVSASLTGLRTANRKTPFFLAYMIVGLGVTFGIAPIRALTFMPLLAEIGNYKHLFAPMVFSMAVAAGVGLEVIIRKNNSVERIKVLLPGMAALLALGIYAASKSPAAYKWAHFAVSGLIPVAAFSVASIVGGRRFIAGVILLVCAATSLNDTGGYRYIHHDNPTAMGGLPFIKYLRAHPDGRFISLYPPFFPNMGMLWNLEDIHGLDALQPKPYWQTLLDVNACDEPEMHRYFLAAGVIGPMPESLMEPGMDKLGLRYIVSPGDLGGIITVRRLARASNVRAPGPKHFHWSVWTIDEDARPVLSTHPPIKIDLPDNAIPSGKDRRIETAVAFNPNTPGPTDGAFMSIVENKNGVSKTLYCRHISETDRGWTSVPVLPDIEPGGARHIVVHPGDESLRDWVGWGFRNAGDSYAGYRKALGGDIGVYASDKPFRKTVMYDTGGNAMMPDPGVEMLFSDEYVVDTGGREGMLALNFLGYRPGWRAWNDRGEVKIRPDRKIELRNETDRVELKYLPSSFRISLWLSVVTLLFCAAALLIRIKK